jgi:uncharacterized membrane protein
MLKNRLEAFSDGVIAIIITIMVLDLKVPAHAEGHGLDWQALGGVWPVLLSYVLSFVYVAIYWNNHHHLLHAAEKVSGGVLWANMHLLFWLSLVPFVTVLVGEYHLTPVPMALYGVVLFMAAVAYALLVQVLIRVHGRTSTLAKAIGSDAKGWISLGLYAVAIAVAAWAPWLSGVLYAAVAGMWLVPDRRIEKHAHAAGGG